MAPGKRKDDGRREASSTTNWGLFVGSAPQHMKVGGGIIVLVFFLPAVVRLDKVATTVDHVVVIAVRGFLALEGFVEHNLGLFAIGRGGRQLDVDRVSLVCKIRGGRASDQGSQRGKESESHELRISIRYG